MHELRIDAAMNSKNTQINNGVLYVVELAITTLLPVLVLRVFTRILTSGDYGLWALAQVYAVFVTGFCNVGLLTAFERNFFEDKTPEGRQKLFCTIWLFVAGCMVLGAGVTFIFSGTLSQWIIREPGHGTLLLTTFCSTCIISLNQYGLMWLKNTEQAKSYLHLGVAEKVTAIAVSLLLVAGFRIGVQGLVLGQLAGAGLLFFLLGARLCKEHLAGNLRGRVRPGEGVTGDWSVQQAHSRCWRLPGRLASSASTIERFATIPNRARRLVRPLVRPARSLNTFGANRTASTIRHDQLEVK